MHRFQKWSERESSPWQRLRLLAGLTIPFVFLPILTLYFVCPLLDRWFGCPSFQWGWVNWLVGFFLFIPGWLLAMWTISIQHTQASGTPVPMMPTQKLLIVGPFQYCRNPMALGTIMFYLGTAVVAGSLVAVGLLALFTILLILYIKTIEEKELVARFGQAYLAYKQNTPFLFPRRPQLYQ